MTAPQTLESLLRLMVEAVASDLHLAVGSPPCIRRDGLLQPLEQFERMDQQAMERIVFPILDADQRDRLTRSRNLDLSYSIPGLSRFRGNLLWQRGTLGAVFRAIPARPLTLAELGMPKVVADLALRPRGLVLVTGPTGSGKSTTLAAMIDHVNESIAHHIVTIEDPIEYLHKNKRCIVRQRELGTDVGSFAEALRFVLRQDPDVILVGEMRDLETIALAVTAAETGHLVLATLHTTSAATTIDRVIDVFPSTQQDQIRLQLATTLEGVLCQTLVPRADGKGRACAMEVMVATPAIRNLVREAKSHQINSVLESGARFGMQSLNMALRDLVARGTVTAEAALDRSSTPEALRSLLALQRSMRDRSR